MGVLAKYRQDRDDQIIKELKAENRKLRQTMQLHAGDCCSLNNEVELFRGHWDDAEERCNKLEEALKLTISRWRLIGREIWDAKVRVSILELERQLEKDVEQILYGKD